jgi:hypothetical protein
VSPHCPSRGEHVTVTRTLSRVVDRVEAYIFNNPRGFATPLVHSGKFWLEPGPPTPLPSGGTRSAAYNVREAVPTLVAFGWMETMGESTHVLLLGWMGAQPRHVEKYEQMYTAAAGVVTTQAIASPSDVMGLHREALLQCILGALARVCSTSPVGPVVVHVFSNGGEFMWNFALRLMYEQDARPAFVTDTQMACALQIKQRLVAEIHDSCPCYMSVPSGLEAISASFGSNAAVRLLLQGGFLVSVVAGAAWSALRGEPSAPEAYWIRCQEWPSRVRQLFIYSPLDRLCDVSKVEEHAATLEANGVEVHRLRFEDTDHVAHYRKHPEAYAEACFRHCGVRAKV